MCLLIVAGSLVFSIVLQTGSSLECGVGYEIVGNSSKGVSINCPFSNPQCGTFRVGSTNNYRFFSCASYETAANEYYGGQYGNGCLCDDFYEFPNFCYCSNTNNCNTETAGLDPFPSATQPSPGRRQCYNGVTTPTAPYLGGSADSCDGLCVTYTLPENASHIFGCVPRDVRIQAGASSDDSCVSIGQLQACFCTGELCNNNFLPYPTPAPGLQCYSGFQYGSTFYGSIETCVEGEVCAGYHFYSDIFQCMTKEACFSYWNEYGAAAEPCEWSGGSLSRMCCCGDQLCNYNADLMAPGGVEPTPNPDTNNRHLLCLDGLACPQCLDGGGPFVGSARQCSGACAFTEIENAWSQWRCLDSDTCLDLGVPLDTCQYDIIGFEKFCCYTNDTATTATSTTAITSPPAPFTTIWPVTETQGPWTTGGPPGDCPPAWVASKSVPNKCYRSEGASPDSWDNTLRKCQALNSRANLVAIRNGFENSEVADIVQSGGYLWLGLHWQNGTWVWADGQTVSYTNWAPGEPFSENSCVKMDRARATWFSDSCNDPFDIACELYL